jgi:hypothetical protein
VLFTTTFLSFRLRTDLSMVRVGNHESLVWTVCAVCTDRALRPQSLLVGQPGLGDDPDGFSFHGRSPVDATSAHLLVCKAQFLHSRSPRRSQRQRVPPRPAGEAPAFPKYIISISLRVLEILRKGVRAHTRQNKRFEGLRCYPGRRPGLIYCTPLGCSGGLLARPEGA